MPTPLVPIAISSQLDVTGEERIHAAKYTNSSDSRADYVLNPVYYIVTAPSSGDSFPFWTFASTSAGPVIDPDSGHALAALAGHGPDNALHAAMSANGVYACFTSSDSPYIHMYKRSGPEYTELTSAFSAVPSDVSITPACMDMSANGQYVACYYNTGTTAKFFWWKRTGDSFVKQTDPASIPAYLADATDGDTGYMKWSPSGTYLLVIKRTEGTTAQTIYIYKNNGTTLTLLSQPDVQLDGVYQTSACWSPTEDVVVITSSTFDELQLTLNVHVYSVAADVFTKRGSYTTAAGNASATCAAFSPDGTHVVIGSWRGGMVLYGRSGNVLTELDQPLGLTDPSRCTGLSYSPDGKYLLGSFVNTSGGTQAVKLLTVAGDVYTLLEQETLLDGADNSIQVGSL